MHSESDQRAGTAGASLGTWGLGLFVLLYFAFPAVLIWPIWMAAGRDYPEWLQVPFFPLIWLVENVEWYEEWVVWGTDLLGMD